MMKSSRRRMVLQVVVGTLIFFSYMQFQLFSISERRLFLKRVFIFFGSGAEKPFQRACSRGEDTGLNLFSWSDEHIHDIESLKNSVLFPKYPSWLNLQVRSALKTTFEKPTGLWLFGKLVAPETGEYRFALSASGQASLYLSSSENPGVYRTMASVPKDEPVDFDQFDKLQSQTTVSLHLQQCREYFIEVFAYIPRNNNHLQIAWETPSALTYTDIPRRFLRPYITEKDVSLLQDNIIVSFKNKLSISDLFYRFSGRQQKLQDRVMEKMKLPFMEKHHAFTDLKECSTKMDGVFYGPRLHIATAIVGNRGLKVIEKYMHKLVQKSGGKYTYHSMQSSEVKMLSNKGIRYLINAEFTDELLGVNTRMSEYLFYDNEDMTLCKKEEFKCGRDVMVTIVHVMREINRWSQYILQQLYDLSSNLRDGRLNIMLVIPTSFETLVDKILSTISVTWHSRLTLFPVNDADIHDYENVIFKTIKKIKGNQGIILITNSQTQIPTNFVEIVRKKTIRGKTLFLPWPANFEKSYQEDEHIINPFELSNNNRPPCFAIYASDWLKLMGLQRTGSDNTNRSSGDWWRAVGDGALEIYASKVPHFLYFPTTDEHTPTHK